MLKDIVAAHSPDNYRLHLRFEDGTEGTVDLAQSLSFRGIFAPLKDPAYFAQVRVDSELGTVIWPKRCRPGPRCALCAGDWEADHFRAGHGLSKFSLHGLGDLVTAL